AVLKDGDDITLIATGIEVSYALLAAERLEKDGISAAVVNMSTIKPIDKDLIIKYARKTGAIVTAEDHNIYNGLGSRVAEVLVENYPVRMLRVGMPDKFGRSGKWNELLKYYEMDDAGIYNAAKKLLEVKK
ncbi:MAG TPA: transketolase family protein, partial [Thermoplasmatales archaeon]|nr:transketolase family protein [Thermoplasmatales archaeon]